jgi:hypothetical protein
LAVGVCKSARGVPLSVVLVAVWLKCAALGALHRKTDAGKQVWGGGGREVAEAAKTFLSIPLGQQGLLS